ncbi:MAG: BlaI/MecI/CopY family transcriptional regulator [Archangium sp.]|nr:BlaI/MecI/CopY family transcriptional regulator [Archangium sp.]
MPNVKKPLPTDAELSILNVLWGKGPSTVRAVFEALPASAGYTTVLKTMQIMAEKGLVKRDESERSHVYRAAVGAEATQERMVGELIDKAFSGSAAQLVMRALESRVSSKEELAAVRALLEKKKGGA